jgi:hypothetical protein
MEFDRKTDPSIDYSMSKLTNSSLSHMRIVPLSGNQTQTVSPSSGTDVTFELPIQCLNLAESYFYADISIPAQGAGNFSWRHQGICPWSAVQLFTRGGQYLCDISANATDYSRVVITSDSTDEELQHGDSSAPLYASGATNYLGGKGGSSTAKPYWEQQYLTVSADNGVQTGRIIFKMKSLKKTIFEVNKSLLFREVLVLKLKLAQGKDLAYLGTSATNPDAGAGDITGDITFSNIAFYCAQERNASVVAGLQALTNSEAGMNVFIPYPTIYSQTRSGTKQNVTLRLNRSHGSSLNSVKNCVFSNSDNNLRYDRDTTSSSKVVSYFSSINNNRLAEFDYVVGEDLDWMGHRKRFKDSPIYNNAIYKQNWVHEDGFLNEANKEDGEEDTNCYGGIDLNNEIRYDINYTTANATHRHVSVVHAQRILNVNSRGLVAQ